VRRVGIRQSRQRLRRYLTRFKAGGAFGDAEFAVLAPTPGHDDAVSFLVTELGATPAAMRPEDLPAPLSAPGPPSEQVIDELRADRH